METSLVLFGLILVVLMLQSFVNGFALTANSLNRSSRIIKSFPSTWTKSAKGINLVMGNNSKFGIFSPAVYAAKFILGDAKLNKLRGKVISLHSQTITDWCLQYGAYNLRTRLIKMAKKNGDELGFLV